MGFSNRLVPVGPTEVKAHKSALFTEGTIEVKVDFQKGRKKISCQFCWIGKDCDQTGDRMSKNNEKFPLGN